MGNLIKRRAFESLRGTCSQCFTMRYLISTYFFTKYTFGLCLYFQMKIQINMQNKFFENSFSIWIICRVTRLGELSPIGWLFTWGSFLQIIEIAQIIGLLISTVKVTFKLWLKTAWATFWAIFSQTHLVTLIICSKQCSCATAVSFVRNSSTRRTRRSKRSKIRLPLIWGRCGANANRWCLKEAF
jgi:hypothetical protein